jgi:peptidoglycan L-alanyl-D-glutamate endopeptidase CwlK
VTLFTFGAQSRACLATCDPRLAAVAEAALAASPYDFGIIEGHRSLDRQAYLFAEGSVNGVPVWEDAQRFAVIAGAILATGNRLGIPLRWGGDWDGDGNARDQSLHDLPHIELVPTSN